MKFKTVIRHAPGTIIDTGHETLKLEIDDEGFGTLDTNNEGSIERLLAIPEGFKPIGLVKADEPGQEDNEAPVDAAEFVLTSEAGTIDLGQLDDEALRKFVADNEIKGVHGKAKGNKLRAAIVAALKASA